MSSEPFPSFYAPEHAADFRHGPDAQRIFEAARAWKKAHGITPSARDTRNVHLLLIDVQKDFCFPEGSLYVGGRSGTGALDDNRRTAEFIYRNLGALTNVTATMDTHHAFQIFFPSFWVDGAGQPLTPHREISVADIDAGRARPNPEMVGWLGEGDLDALTRQARFYCESLEKAGKYRLYLWPPHCILGSEGHALAGVIHAARMFHSYARDVQSWVELKGGNPLTENYSVIGAEVLSRFDGTSLAERNSTLLKTLMNSDALYVAGQAASHCVKSTLDDLLEEIVRTDETLARKVFLLTDCMSSVTVPDGRGGFLADFTSQSETALARYASAGMRLVKSTEPVG